MKLTAYLIIHLFPAVCFLGCAVGSIIFAVGREPGYAITLSAAALAILATWLSAWPVINESVPE